ncbi:MAG: helix-turn-helix transcriptional regulator, partial [Firmicutes bacterium]|nr:helix-turn-helix transcriptional regulator [Bacillota bacterium]
MTLGNYLSEIRKSKGLTLKDVSTNTTVTDSVLSRIENDKTDTPDPKALKELARYYDISIIDLYMVAGYLEEEDLVQHKFSGIELLNDEAIKQIQGVID